MTMIFQFQFLYLIFYIIFEEKTFAHTITMNKKDTKYLNYCVFILGKL